jgi:hypothetical protein
MTHSYDACKAEEMGGGSHCARCSHEARILAAAPISPGRVKRVKQVKQVKRVKRVKAEAQPASVGRQTSDVGRTFQQLRICLTRQHPLSS